MEKQAAGTAEEWTPQYLVNDDGWTQDYFDPDDKTARFARRVYFAGPMSL